MVLLACWVSAVSLAAALGKADRLVIEREWRRDDCGVADAQQLIIRTRQEWATLWRTLHRNRIPTPPLPEVDFSRQMVLGVFLGQRPSGGASIEIASITREKAGLVVEVRTAEPSPDAPRTMALTQPCHVVVVTAPDAPTRFQFR